MAEVKTLPLRLLKSKNQGFWTFYYFDRTSSNDSKAPAGSRRHAVKLHLDIDEKDYTEANIDKILKVMVELRTSFGDGFPVIDFKRCQIGKREYEFDYRGHAQFTLYLAKNKSDDIIAQFIPELNKHLQQLGITYSHARGDCISIGANGVSLRYDTSSIAPRFSKQDMLDEILWSIKYKALEQWYKALQELPNYQTAIKACSENLETYINEIIKDFLNPNQQGQPLQKKIFINIQEYLTTVQATIKKTIEQIADHSQIEQIRKMISASFSYSSTILTHKEMLLG